MIIILPSFCAFLHSPMNVRYIHSNTTLPPHDTSAIFLFLLCYHAFVHTPYLLTNTTIPSTWHQYLLPHVLLCFPALTYSLVSGIFQLTTPSRKEKKQELTAINTTPTFLLRCRAFLHSPISVRHFSMKKKNTRPREAMRPRHIIRSWSCSGHEWSWEWDPPIIACKQSLEW